MGWDSVKYCVIFNKVYLNRGIENMFFVTIFKLFITTDGKFKSKSNNMNIYLVIANKSKDYKLVLLYKLFIR